MNRAEEEARLVAQRRIADWMRSRRITRREAAELIHAASRPGFADRLPQRSEPVPDPRAIRTTTVPGTLPASRLKHR